MPKELPGFYYDPEKNRYFPVKGPIPGSFRSALRSSNAQRDDSGLQQENDKSNINGINRIRSAKLLQLRELYGNLVTFNKWKCNFQYEHEKIQASQPTIWKYQNLPKASYGALEHLAVRALTPEGEKEIDVLLTGIMNGTLSLYEFEMVGHLSPYGVSVSPDKVWPQSIQDQSACYEVPGSPGYICRPTNAYSVMPSGISLIKRLGRHSHSTVEDFSTSRHALLATLGSETSGGSLYVLNLSESLDFYRRFLMKRKLFEVATFNCTIWTADCNPNRRQAVIGTNLGAAMVNLETGMATWVLRSGSDVISQQFDQLGNVVLCGLRNGAIVTVDVRQKQEESSARLPRHQIHNPSHNVCEPSNRTHQTSTKKWFELRGNICPSHPIFMPSSISSLLSLQFCDQYFLASSMDGSIQLYDHRLTKRGAVQSYEGHVNSHTRIELGVDPSERFVLSGGEDCSVRIWSIKTGELLFGSKISDSVPVAVCWPELVMEQQLSYKRRLYGENHSWEAWLGSEDELFYIHGP